MKHRLFLLFAFFGIISLYSCTDKKKNECVDYFDGVKPTLSARHATLNAIADTTSDLPEASIEAFVAKLFLEDALKKKNDPYGFKSRKGIPLNLTEVFILPVETFRNKEKAKDYAEDDPSLKIYRKDMGTELLQYGEDVRNGKKDCFNGTIQNYLERDISEYLKVKYLVITDCIYIRLPKLEGGSSFIQGAVAKQVRVIDISTAKEIRSFYVTGESSPGLTIRDYDYSELNKDLMRNFTKNLKAAL